MYIFRCLRSDLVTPGDSTLFVANGPKSLWNAIPSPSSSEGKKSKFTFKPR